MTKHLLTVEDVVKQLNVTPRTLHYYEEYGLITPTERTAGGHRLYDDDVVEKLEHIMRLKKSLGYSLQEIHVILKVETALDELKATINSDVSSDEKTRVEQESIALLHQVIGNIDDKVANLTRMRKKFQARLDQTEKPTLPLSEEPHEI